jgi:hypothetical protein
MAKTSPNQDKPGHVVLLSTAYLPCLDYFAIAAGASCLLLELHETYPRQTWRNRCRILTANGTYDMVIPVVKPSGRPTKTGEVQPGMHLSWQKQHWRTIYSAYSNAPYFLYYQDLISDLYFGSKPDSLIEWNLVLFRQVAGELGLLPKISFTESFHKDYGKEDFRFAFSPKPHKNILLKGFTGPAYPQVFTHDESFSPNLSIIDLLFNTGPDAREYLLNCSGKIYSQFNAG